MIGKKLKNAPLKEVVFELFWKMSTGIGGEPNDPGYHLAIGNFAKEIKKLFPVRKRVLPEGIIVYPKPEFQFWREEATWPVVQIGPGILTVNDTDKNYSWKDNFKSNIDHAVEKLISSYEIPPNYIRARLQYIDIVDVSSESEIEKAIEDKLQTSIKRGYKLFGDLKGIAVDQTYLLKDESKLRVTITSGKDRLTSKYVIILTTVVEKILSSNDQLFDWLESAHTVASETFVKMINPDFYAQLDK